MRRIFQHYHVSTQFPSVNTLKSALVYSNDKQLQNSNPKNKNPSLYCNGGTTNYAITFLGSLHIHNTQLFSISEMLRRKEINRKTTPVVTTTTTLMKTIGTGRNVGLPQCFSLVANNLTFESIYMKWFHHQLRCKF